MMTTGFRDVHKGGIIHPANDNTGSLPNCLPHIRPRQVYPERLRTEAAFCFAFWYLKKHRHGHVANLP
jgi:hypothetical protein